MYGYRRRSAHLLRGLPQIPAGIICTRQPVRCRDYSDRYGIHSVNGLENAVNDPCLQSLIGTALVRNTDYNVAGLRTRQALASLGAAKLAYFPSLNFGADGNVSRYDGLTTKTYNIGVNASWEIDIFGKLTAAKREAAAAAVSASEQAQAVRTQLLSPIHI